MIMVEVVVVISAFDEAHVKGIFLLEATRCLDLRSEYYADEG